jgi:uncharacterized protein RhaS with RHS repeats
VNDYHRWYDPATGKWLSEDPTGFRAGDADLTRYAGNSATTLVDPTGLVDIKPKPPDPNEEKYSAEMKKAQSQASWMVEWTYEAIQEAATKKKATLPISVAMIENKVAQAVFQAKIEAALKNMSLKYVQNQVVIVYRIE